MNREELDSLLASYGAKLYEKQVMARAEILSARRREQALSEQRAAEFWRAVEQQQAGPVLAWPRKEEAK